MARIMDFSPEQQAEYDAWVQARPPCIQAMLATHPPYLLYLNKPAGKQRVVITSYQEDGTVTVAVLAKYNLCTYERNVFGVPLSSLEECDLPAEGEPIGVALTEPDQIEAFIDAARPAVLAARGFDNPLERAEAIRQEREANLGPKED